MVNDGFVWIFLDVSFSPGSLPSSFSTSGSSRAHPFLLYHFKVCPRGKGGLNRPGSGEVCHFRVCLGLLYYVHVNRQACLIPNKDSLVRDHLFISNQIQSPGKPCSLPKRWKETFLVQSDCLPLGSFQSILAIFHQNNHVKKGFVNSKDYPPSNDNASIYWTYFQYLPYWMFYCSD